MTKPTEGPYHWQRVGCRIKQTETGNNVASVDVAHKDERELNATGRLLAASWEMREILKEAVEAKTPEGGPWLVGWRWSEARALLARIDGETE